MGLYQEAKEAMKGNAKIAIGEARKVSGWVGGANGPPEKRTRKLVAKYRGPQGIGDFSVVGWRTPKPCPLTRMDGEVEGLWTPPT